MKDKSKDTRKKRHDFDCGWYRDDGSPCDCGLKIGNCEFEKCKKKAKYFAVDWYLCKEHVFAVYGVKRHMFKKIQETLNRNLV